MKWILLLSILLCANLFVSLKETYHDVYIQEKYVKHETAPTTPLLFVGDIMLGRYVETLANQSHDTMRSFQQVNSLLKSSVVIANLEGPIPVTHEPTPINGFSFSFPSSTPFVLKKSGIHAVTLANNHMYDKGEKGYLTTIASLKKEGILPFGGYTPTASFAEFPLHTGTATILGFSMISNLWDEQKALSIIDTLRTQKPATYLIVFMHWGDEYKTQNEYQRVFAEKMIDHGVDAIIGAHPHVVQGIELYKGKPIFYSLGNFIFDQYWQKDLEDGLAIKLISTDTRFSFELIPIRSHKSVPYVATSTEKSRILEKIAEQSPENVKDFITSGVIILDKP